jgi:hypothetical protein
MPPAALWSINQQKRRARTNAAVTGRRLWHTSMRWPTMSIPPLLTVAIVGVAPMRQRCCTTVLAAGAANAPAAQGNPQTERQRRQGVFRALVCALSVSIERGSHGHRALQPRGRSARAEAGRATALLLLSAKQSAPGTSATSDATVITQGPIIAQTSPAPSSGAFAENKR